MLNDVGIRDLVVVTGCHEGRIRSLLGGRVKYSYYPDFGATNNLYTLRHCRNLLDRPSVVMFSDVLVERSAFNELLSPQSDYLILVDTSKNRRGTMRVRIDDGVLTDIGQNVSPSEGHGNFVGISAMSEQGAGRLGEELEEMAREGGFVDDYFTRALPRLIQKGSSLDVRSIAGLCWFEIDTIADYCRAVFMRRYLDRASAPN